MKKQTKLALCLLILLAVILTGCGSSKTADDSKNKYKLPLGESGYLAEMDFDLFKDESNTLENGNVETIKYDYVSGKTKCSVVVNAWTNEENHVGKTIKFVCGYYDENNKFVSYGTEANIELTKSETSYSLDFDLPNEENLHKETSVLKMCFGTSVDEEKNPNASKKEKNQTIKQYRSSCFYINKLEANDNNLLVENVTISPDNTVARVITKENNDLYYYNTATLSYAQETLTITLNNKSGWWQWIIAKLGELLNFITMKIAGGHYWLGMLIFTLVVRTLGWPIYAKTNSASTGMAKIQPEMEKLNKKYEGKTDQNSKMKQQMEMRELMKKNHVSMFGCLLPFAQMPIFFAVYQVVQRFPLTPIYANCDYKFLWTSFAMDYGQASGDWILAIIVGLTMVASQELSTYMTKRIQAKKANFYTAKNQSNNNQMRIMMLVMTVMMVVFAWKSSGIAFYWIIGNTYQIGQTLISKHFEEKKTEKEIIASGKSRGR